MKTRRLRLALGISLLFGVQLLAASAANSSQNPPSENPASANAPDASVRFKLSWPQVHPSEYSVVVHRDGRAEYMSSDKGLSPPQERNSPVESNAEQVAQSEDAASQDVFHKEFTASDSLREKVFSLAEKANFFDGQFDFTAHPVAQTGRKTLSYSDGLHHFSTTYNYSENPSIDGLTSIFEGISETIEGGQKLEFDRRFEKLALDEDLKNMEELANSGRLQEVQVIAPILQRLARDRTILHIAQERAERILRKAGLPTAAAE